jgi:hypothetical protein
MQTKAFFASAPGRIVCVTAFVALLGPGAMALAGPSPRDVSYSAGLVILCIIGFSAACMLSVYQYVLAALAISFFGTLIAGPYVAALSVVARTGALFGWLLTGLALLPLATTIVASFHSGTGSSAAPRASGSARVHS